MFVHYTFSSVWVAEREIATRSVSNLFSLYFVCFCGTCMYLFPVLVLRAGFAFGFSSSCSLLFYYFNYPFSVLKSDDSTFSQL